MNKSPNAPRLIGRRRAPLIGVLIASGALLVAACGGGPDNAAVAHLGTTTTTNAPSSKGVTPPVTNNDSGPSAGSSGPSGGPGGGGPHSGFSINVGGNTADALAFSKCMSSHGLPNFPEPNAQGDIQGNNIDPNSSTFQAAAKACRHFLPNGGQPTPAQQAKALAQAIKYSQCMRSHGISDFPDPQSVPGGGIRIALRAGQGSDLDPNSTQFQAAQKTCQGLTGGPFGPG